ncbi:hypothetical protein [Alteribacter keqinensis]|uniref:Uncharacterized protein n=1 Tax=Alteribacter keqinensis TaxID=2483800 RepID=A0A3M7TQH1_9BACI|nr:hypothetical protein [Alteribacter keqinensis]RNA66939.1 hypothetical protein EBO34_17215 [Alteribacter keqinensis]
MTIRELYHFAIAGNYMSLIYLIEWLRYDQGISMERDAKNIDYIFETYGKDLSHHITAYQKKVEERGRHTDFK